ncbi:MAG: hypothetical protein GXP31_04600 [Kiritimatiellaeota bacterium]|nr:hypothetical protein [Kiritimatiellota bacterium]
MSTPPTSPFTSAPEPKKPKGCLFWGCLGASVICLLGLLAAGLGLKMAHKRVLGFTDATPAAIPVAQVNANQARRIRLKALAFQTALQKGRPGTFRFTADDLNAMIAADKSAESLKGKAFLTIDGNRLIADACLPLDRVPGLRGRYINGKIQLDIQIRNGRLEVYPLDIIVKGKPLPPRLMKVFKTRNLAEQIQADPNVQKALAHIESLEIVNGAVVVKTK